MTRKTESGYELNIFFACNPGDPDSAEYIAGLVGIVADFRAKMAATDCEISPLTWRPRRRNGRAAQRRDADNAAADFHEVMKNLTGTAGQGAANPRPTEAPESACDRSILPVAETPAPIAVSVCPDCEGTGARRYACQGSHEYGLLSCSTCRGTGLIADAAAVRDSRPADPPPPAGDDGLDIPESLRRVPRHMI
ncbi:MAG: hypothetical protein ACREEP_01715 [Dongiaceae bacterium]